MSFHTWLASTPKHHLTSYAMDEVVARKGLTSGRRPKHTGNTGYGHAAAAHHHFPTYLMPYEQQAAVDALPPSLRPNRPIINDDFDVVGMPHPPITPPTDKLPYSPECVYDHSPPSGPKEHYLPEGYHVPHVQPHPSASRQMKSSPARDICHPPTTKDPVRHQKGLLPSPPASPQHVMSETLLHVANARPLPSPGGTETPSNLPSQDPMFQTSTNAHFWSTNCTVLKVDTCIRHGNVTSPTCMVGLPFGSMTEMIVPSSFSGSDNVNDHDEETRD